MTDLQNFSWDDVQRVEFFKRDEMTTDLICCEITARSATLFSDEEAPEWPELVGRLSELPGFREDWFSHVSQPPFAECRFVAFEKAP